jgi:hypothetical protein
MSAEIIELRDTFKARRANKSRASIDIDRAVEQVDAILHAVWILRRKGHGLEELARALRACTDAWVQEAGLHLSPTFAEDANR